MNPETEEKLAAFFAGFRGEGQPILLLDYDGTLAPFRVNRFEARPFAGVRELLMRIQMQGATRMAVVTGRPSGEIAPLLGLDVSLNVWGLHGAERMFPDGRRELELEAAPAALEKLQELRERLQSDSLGGLFEDKPNACVMHWRGLPPQKARAVEKKTRGLFEPLAEMDGLSLLEFEAGLELRVGRDKGGAVNAILDDAGAHGPVVYLGDDLTDESAFRAVNGLGGTHLSVLMRHSWRETDADVWLQPPGELREFLGFWLRAVEGKEWMKAPKNDEELTVV